MRRLVGLLAAISLAGCAGGGEDDRLVVFADPAVSSIAQALDPGAVVVVAASSDLAARIREGSNADVFLAASAPLEELRADGLVDAATAFAENRLVIVVPRRNRAKVEHIVDLTRKGVRLVLGAKGVAVGDLARRSLELAGLGAANDNVVGVEQTERALLDEVAAARADAAIVYATGVDDEVGRQVQVFEISPYFQPEIRYAAVAVSPASEEASDYLARLSGDEGFEAVVDSGLRPAQP